MALQIVNICGGCYRENNKETCFKKKPIIKKIDKDTTVALQKEKKNKKEGRNIFLSLVTKLMHPHPNIYPYKQSCNNAVSSHRLCISTKHCLFLSI